MLLNIPVEIKRVLNKIENSGFDAYLVGGCVRDFLMDIAPNDFDITTSAYPDDVLNIFSEYKCYELGKKYGTILVDFEGYFVEITTFRIESEYENNRKPKSVIFTRNLREDLARRDFTINAMAMDFKGNIIDYFGGISDLNNKLIRTVGNAEDRFNEDALRILRAIRFYSRFDFKLDNALEEAIIKNGKLLNSLSKERISSEFNKIITVNKPSKVILKMVELNIFHHIFVELSNIVDFQQDTPHHDKNLLEHTIAVMDNVCNTLELRLAALFHDIGKPICKKIDENNVAHYYEHDKIGAQLTKNILKEYKYSNSIMNKVCLLIEEHMKVFTRLSDKALIRQIKRVGRDNVEDLYELMIADRKATKEGRDFSDLEYNLCRIRELLQKEILKEHFLKIDGSDIIGLGFKQGKIIGDILKLLEDRVLENPELNEKEILKKIIIEEYRR